MVACPDAVVASVDSLAVVRSAAQECLTMVRDQAEVTGGPADLGTGQGAVTGEVAALEATGGVVGLAAIEDLADLAAVEVVARAGCPTSTR